MDMSRKEFVAVLAGSAVLAGGGAMTGSAAAAPKTLGSAASALSQPLLVDPEWEAAQQETLIRPYVIACHRDLDEARAGLRNEPRLANARLYAFDEAPIEAASHMGRPDIAYLLLGSGAPLTVHCAVMLGLADVAAAYLDRDAGLAVSPGAHGIAMMFHAALSGNIAVAELLQARGGGQDYSEALHAAAMQDDPAMASWLIAQGADLSFRDKQDRTPLERATAEGATAILPLLTGLPLPEANG